jgi:hypothetical protein
MTLILIAVNGLLPHPDSPVRDDLAVGDVGWER